MSSDTPLSILGGLTAETFLRDYWQKKPLLIRGAFPDFESPLAPEELAGLACEDGIEARLVEAHGPDKPWQVSHGPFDDATFARLPDREWSLLVQAVDHYVPEVAALLEAFDFLPRWRLDDVMVSYAPPEGSVGPHVDSYDVFLLQGSGQRRWQLGGEQPDDAPIVSGVDLRMLERFEVAPGEDWVLEPGDMLYLPPRIAHHGVSQSADCMTYSIGFRAPSTDEIITSFADYLGEMQSETSRYTDPDLRPIEHAGRVDDDAIARLRTLVLSVIDDPAQMTQWFGRVMTQPKYADQLAPLETPTDSDAITEGLSQGHYLERALGSRFAFHEENGRTTLFTDGDGHDCPPGLARLLADTTPLHAATLASHLDDQALTLLAKLVSQGSLHWQDETQENDDE
ncbi:MULTISPECIES: ribosomal protein uL16 3-hydroxylase [Chromohalobacter]|uniref:JmjC domain-containing protein n=1 Tax=Chromohalobacter beijerinckii TaxID=86179 RepID=A0ABV8XE66_9GAMM|nr:MULTISPECIES: cupin domain-containing protein [Chromohalobacter]MCK0753926.1 cupin domain-containing protein [Chromohalobacter japonicus]MCK0766642.1 cupin domain-containing protein [Chromohalobacter beijerinckii]